MNTKIIAVLLAHMIFTGLLNVNAQGKIKDFNRDEIKELLFRVADWQSQQTEHMARYHPLNWHFAAYYIGVMEMYKATGEKKYLDRMYVLGKEHNWTTLSNAYDADRIAVGQIYLDVHREYLEYAIEHWLITTDYLWDNEENLIYRNFRVWELAR